jgi:iron complex transport system ATP-binding protein
MKLEISNLCCGYEQSRVIVKNVSFTLQGGDICCILGRNGIGKSTLFKTLLKLMPPLSGRVSINGEDIKDWSPKQMAAVSAYVSSRMFRRSRFSFARWCCSQDGEARTVQAARQEDTELVETILAELGIAHLKSKPYTEISGGERQLTMIARALAQEPQMLVLDEPAANLDYGNKVLIMEKIQTLAEKGICVIFTTHDPEHALLLDAKTVMLRHGEPPLFGNSASVITEKTLKEAYNANIRVVEIVDEGGRPVRVCLPSLRR